MDVIILAGGRGRRLGALTVHCPKANLHFAGKSLLAHVLSSLKGSESRIERVCIATGYGVEKLKAQYRRNAREISSGVPIRLLPVESELAGTFSSVAWALNVAKVTRCCLILGIDAIVTQSVMGEFIASIRNETHTTFMVSLLLDIAPTHGRILLGHNDEIREYRKSSVSVRQTLQHGWYCDVGIRYFSAEFVRKCRSFSFVRRLEGLVPSHSPWFSGVCDFDDIMPSTSRKRRNLQSVRAERAMVALRHQS